MKGVTPYQQEILRRVRDAQAADEPMDLDQMVDTLSWEPSKESLQFSIRALCKRGLISKTELLLRRGRKRVCFELTNEGRLILDPRGPVTSALVQETVQEVFDRSKTGGGIVADEATEPKKEADEDLVPGFPEIIE